jgi:hypothetical protein
LLIYHQRAGRLAVVDSLHSEDDGLALMNKVWQYVTPTAMGVHTTGIFQAGLKSLLRDEGVSLQPHALLIPRRRGLRPSLGTVAGFIRSGLAEDSPVAFLNLSNGAIDQLDPWHWVTVTGLDESRPDQILLEILDNLNRLTVDLAMWLETTALGGGFVYLTARQPSPDASLQNLPDRPDLADSLDLTDQIRSNS